MHRTLALFAVTAAAGATRHAGDSRDVKSGDRNERAAAVNHTVSQIWQHGEGGCTCIGVPALIHTRNATVLAFAECRMWTGDGCLPAKTAAAPALPGPCNGNHTCITMKRSEDGGRSWSAQHIVMHKGGNVMAVWDAVRSRVVLNYSPGQPYAKDPPYIEASAATLSTIGSTDSEQILSDVAWSRPRQIAQYPNGWASQPGPGTAVQLRPGSAHAGRLVFAGWMHNNGRTCDVVVWMSDDGGDTFRQSAGGLINGTCETSLSQLGDGRIVLLGNDGGVVDKGGCSVTGTNTLQHYYSSDGGDSFGPVQCDAALVNADCQAPILAVGSSIVVANPEGRTHPPDPPGHGAFDRTNMVVHVSDDGKTFNALPVTFDTGGGVNATPAGYSSLTFVNTNAPRTVGLGWETDGPGQSCKGEPGAGARCRILFSVFDVPA
jgi:hypothetical protein